MTCKNIPFLPAGSAVAVHHEDAGPWMHGTVVGNGSDNHQDRCYKIQVARTGHCITGIEDISKTTQITAEEYTRNKVLKIDTRQSAYRYAELKDCYTKLYEHGE